MKRLCIAVLGLLSGSCYNPERNCGDFREGTFEFTTVIGNTEETTRFSRSVSLEISNYQGVTDSANVRWINNCEYVLTNINPKSNTEEKPIHIKILSTTSDSYTFEYKLLGTTTAKRGTAFKIN